MKVTEGVPKYQIGEDVLDYNSAFNTTTTSNSIQLGENPVYIEELTSSTGSGKCGDGVCDDFEKANPTVCSKDCIGQKIACASNSDCGTNSSSGPAYCL